MLMVPVKKSFIMRPIHVLVCVYRSRRNSGRILLIFKTQLTIKTDSNVLPLTGDLNGNIPASCWMSAPASLPVDWHTSRKFPHAVLSRLFQGHNFHFLPTSPQLCETNQPSHVPNMSKPLLARQQSRAIRCCSNA